MRAITLPDPTKTAEPLKTSVTALFKPKKNGGCHIVDFSELANRGVCLGCESCPWKGTLTGVLLRFKGPAAQLLRLFSGCCLAPRNANAGDNSSRLYQNGRALEKFCHTPLQTENKIGGVTWSIFPSSQIEECGWAVNLAHGKEL